MKTIRLTIALAISAMLIISCKSKNSCSGDECQECATKTVIPNVPRGEQAPPANPGQRNFGGMIPPAI